MARIRTLQRAIIELKNDDPKCDLTLSALRAKVIQGKIPYDRSGNKYLVDVDKIIEYLFGEVKEVQNEIK